MAKYTKDMISGAVTMIAVAMGIIFDKEGQGVECQGDRLCCGVDYGSTQFREHFHFLLGTFLKFSFFCLKFEIHFSDFRSNFVIWGNFRILVCRIFKMLNF